MSYLIDATSEEISYGNYSAIDNLTTHTWAFWVYWNTDGGGGFGRIIDKRQTGSQGHVLWRESGTEWGYYDYRWSTQRGSWKWPEPTQSAWVHVVLTYDAGSTGNDPTLYYDGVSQSITELVTPAGTHSLADNIEMIVGNRAAGDRYADAYFAELGFWDRVLSAGEIAQLADGYTPDFIQDGLVLYSPLVRDAQNKIAGNNGTITGATAAPHPPNVIRRSGQIILFPPAAGGATTIDLTTASLTTSAQSLQTAVNIELSAASVTFTAAAISLSLVVTLTVAAVTFTAANLQLTIILTLAAAALTFTTNAIDIIRTTIINLTAAALRFTAKAITITSGDILRYPVHKIVQGIVTPIKKAINRTDQE